MRDPQRLRAESALHSIRSPTRSTGLSWRASMELSNSGPPGASLAFAAGPCSAAAAWRWHLVMERIGCCGRLGHGPAVPEPKCGGGRHCPPQLALVGHWHFSILARPGLWHRCDRTGCGRCSWWAHRKRLLARRHRHVGVRRGAAVLGRRNAPAPEPGRLSDLRITWPAPERPPPATSSIHRQRSTLNGKPPPHQSPQGHQLP